MFNALDPAARGGHHGFSSRVQLKRRRIANRHAHHAKEQEVRRLIDDVPPVTDGFF